MTDTDRRAKLDRLVGALLAEPEGEAMLQEALEARGRRLMRRVTPETFPTCADPARLAAARSGVILDVETTGLEAGKDEVIQLAMLRFRWDEQGILEIGEIFDRMREPSVPISEEITRITGISAADVAGRSIDPAEIAAFLAGAEIVLAHKADFDRPFCERQFPGAGFDRLDWHCTLEQVDWKARGLSSRSLELVLLSQGFVYDAHRADEDIRALAFALTFEAEGRGSAFAEMLRAGADGAVQLVAERSPFETKDVLKGAGWRWSGDGSEAHGHKAWHATLPARRETLVEAAALLRDRVYGKDVAIPAWFMGPRERYSTRPARSFTFRTATPRTLNELDSQGQLDIGCAEI